MMHKKIFVTVLVAVLTIGTHYTHAQAPTNTINEHAAIINAYFKERNMPLEGQGLEMVAASDKYNLDWRLLPAIAIQESSGGKHMCKNNPYGYGSCKITFTSVSAATEKVAQTLGGFNKNVNVYKNTDTAEKLHYYNGTVVPAYPNEVMATMNRISHE